MGLVKNNIFRVFIFSVLCTSVAESATNFTKIRTAQLVVSANGEHIENSVQDVNETKTICANAKAKLEDLWGKNWFKYGVVPTSIVATACGLGHYFGITGLIYSWFILQEKNEKKSNLKDDGDNEGEDKEVEDEVDVDSILNEDEKDLSDDESGQSIAVDDEETFVQVEKTKEVDIVEKVEEEIKTPNSDDKFKASLEEDFEKKPALDDRRDALVPEDKDHDLYEEVEEPSIVNVEVEEVEDTPISDENIEEPSILDDNKENTSFSDDKDIEEVEKPSTINEKVEEVKKIQISDDKVEEDKIEEVLFDEEDFREIGLTEEEVSYLEKEVKNLSDSNENNEKEVEKVAETSDLDGQAKENVSPLIEDEKEDQLALKNTKKKTEHAAQQG